MDFRHGSNLFGGRFVVLNYRSAIRADHQEVIERRVSLILRINRRQNGKREKNFMTVTCITRVTVFAGNISKTTITHHRQR